MQASRDDEVDSDNARFNVAEPRGHVHEFATGPADWGRSRCATDNRGRDECHQRVDEIRIEERAMNRGPTLDQHRVDPALRQKT